MSVTESELRDPALLGEVDLAYAAAQEEAGDEEVGAHVGTHIEAETAVTHLFEAGKAGYHGWRWAVTVASAGPDTDVTVSEVVLLPGPDALVAPDWVPWEHRVQAGDLGVGDLLPTAPDDPRLVPSYVASDDATVEELAREVGLGRPRVMARPARLEAAARWQHSEFGPRSDMARSAPAHCGTCGFYLPLAGSLRAAFGTCGNEISPADGHVVHAEYGCGAHSEAEVEQVSPVLVANLIYDDALLEVDAAPAQAELSDPEPAAEQLAAEPVAPLEAVVTAETRIEPPAAVPDQGGLLRGGLLRVGGLLSGGLLRNRRTPPEAATESTSPGEGDEEPAQAESPTDAAAAPEAPGGDAAIDAIDSRTESSPAPEFAADETEARSEPATAPEAEPTAADAIDAEAETSEVERIPEAVAPEATASASQPEHTIEATTAEASQLDTELTSEPEQVTEDAPEATAEATPEATQATAAAEEHRRWQPSFRPYWMRSADERRTEGD